MTESIGLRRRAAAVLLASVLAGLGSVVLLSPGPATAASKCASLTKRVHLFVNARRGVNVLTYNPKRFAALKKSGYTDRGVLFKAGGKKKGLTAVRVMSNKRTRDRIYTTSKSEISKLKKKGYKNNGTGFYAATKTDSCLHPVYRLRKGNVHRFALASADRRALIKQGWVQEKRAFWVAQPPSPVKPPASTGPLPTGDTTFTIAVLPDTQQEVLSAEDTRLANRTQWLVDNRKKLDLRFVTHTGDIVNWDTTDHIQYVRAQAAMQKLNKAGMAYSLSPGNHDTAAVCEGGSACDPRRTRTLVRDTTSFNRYLGDGTRDIAGRFEADKVDNSYSRFQAGSRNWLILNLELWPRVAVVNWAKGVVAAHPHDNVIVVTHSYLTSAGSISTNSEYGDTSPTYLSDNLISRYSNIKIVLSGHAGMSFHRVDYGLAKNRIDTFLLTMHDNRTNPTRLIEIDTRASTLRSWVYAPFTNTSYPGYNVNVKQRWTN